jgi:hypothetical protein
VLTAGNAEPVESTATGFNKLIAVVAAFGARDTWIVATTPAVIAVVFNPVRRQESWPDAETHWMALPAAAAAGPTVAKIPEIWFEGKASVHCNAAGVAPPAPKDRARLVDWPGVAVTDERLREAGAPASAPLSG